MILSISRSKRLKKAINIAIDAAFFPEGSSGEIYATATFQGQIDNI